MTSFAASIITRDRLGMWQRRNEREQLPCTPVCLVNVMHGKHAGKLVINTPENISDEQVLHVLETAVREIKLKIGRGN